jgi:glycosyltransferase involved in cell wall biosynthesis
VKEIGKRSIGIFLLLLFFLPIFAYSTPSQPLTVNIFSIRNGRGLQTDQKVLQEALQQLGHSVVCINYGEKAKKRAADINIFFEHPFSDKLTWAKYNWLIPNPEWYTQDLKLLDKMDLILCRTRECERIFQTKHYPTYYLGFTSPDCYQSDVEKDFSLFLHLAGGSSQKGTEAILRIWKSHYPHLTVIKQSSEWIVSQRNLKFITTFIPEKELRQLQNQCGIHLCPSETEGFGHYIMEAMSTQAVVVTTDAPPMNEFIRDQRCLVPFFKSSPQRLGMNYYVDSKDLKNKIDALLVLSQEELRKIGEDNRVIYLQKKQEFQERLKQLLQEIATSKRKR